MSGKPMTRLEATAAVSGKQATLSLLFEPKSIADGRNWFADKLKSLGVLRPEKAPDGLQGCNFGVDLPTTLNVVVRLRWPIAVGRYAIEGGATRRVDNGAWDFRPGAGLAPEIEKTEVQLLGGLMSRDNMEVDQLLTGVLVIQRVRAGAMEGRLELISRGALDASFASNFDVAW